MAMFKLYRKFRMMFERAYLSFSLSRKNPLAKSPKADRKTYQDLATTAASQTYPEIVEFERQSGYAVETAWLADLALHTQIVIKRSPLCYAHGRVIYSALCRYLKNLDMSETVSILETGTARGFSSLCMAKALHDMKRSGSVVTIDRLPHKIPIFWNCIDDLDGKKTRQELLFPWQSLVERYLVYLEGDSRELLPRLGMQRINVAFLDGAHSREDVLFEFNHIYDSQKIGDLIIFDDYTVEQFPGIVAAVDEICSSKNYHKQVLKAHQGRGYVVAIKQRSDVGV
jgi:predicted O-methyltransferase YrrM